jgi:GNAT superfamily N-acetyltransferase
VIGFELKPRLFYTWFYGVLGPHRRQGISSQLMEALHSWCRQNDYEAIRLECFNRQRPMLHQALNQEDDIIGIRWDHDHNDNLILLQKMLVTG